MQYKFMRLMYALQFQITQQLRLICLHCLVSSREYLCLLGSFAWFSISLVKRNIRERVLLQMPMPVLQCFLPVTQVSHTEPQFMQIYNYFHRNSIDNTIKSTIIEIESTLDGIDRLIWTSFIGRYERCQRFTIKTR